MYRMIFYFFFLFIFASVGYACTCTVLVGKSDKELVESARASSDAVFVGRVIKIVKKRNGRGVPTGGYNAVFDVSEMWKGTQKKQIRIFSSGQCCLCDLSFSKGKKYLVYAFHAYSDKMLTASTCSRTREIDDAQIKIDRQYLGSPNKTALKN